MPATIDGHRHHVLRLQRQRRWRAGSGERPTAPAPPGTPGGLAHVRDLLDQAHRDLGAAELVEVLLAVRRRAAPMAYGRPPRRPSGPELPSVTGRSPAARAFVRPVEVALHLLARDVRRRPAVLAAAWEALDAHLHEVASRPRRSAVSPAWVVARAPPPADLRAP